MTSDGKKADAQRPSVAASFGFDPFERVVDFLVQSLIATNRPPIT